MLIRVLGAIEAEMNGRAAHLGGGHQRALLAMLLVARGDVVSVDRLIDGLWRGEPPAKAVASLQTYIAHLRRLLEPDRPPRAPARILVSAAPGYALKLDDDVVDAWRFERLVRRAREIGPADPAAATAVLDQALGLWRGAAYAEVAEEEWAIAETSRLEELRASALELSVELTLRRGAPAEAVPTAETLTRHRPLREEGWRLLALALWGANRQADALTALRRARAALSDELGLDPGPALVQLEDAILNQRMPVLHAALRPKAPQPPTPQPGPLPPHPQTPSQPHSPAPLAAQPIGPRPGTPPHTAPLPDLLRSGTARLAPSAPGTPHPSRHAAPQAAGAPDLSPPGSAQPTAAAPGTAQPATHQATGSPGLPPHGSAQSGTASPGTSQSPAIQLDTGQPGLSTLGSAQSATAVPDANQAAASRHTATWPGAHQLGVPQPAGPHSATPPSGAPHIAGSHNLGAAPGIAGTPASVPDGSGATVPPSSALPSPATFVGRQAELTALLAAADAVEAGRAGIAVVTGEPGAGKSALLGRLLEYVTARHWQAAVGRCPEDEGAPAAWAWVEALRPLAERTPPAEGMQALAPLLGDESAVIRFSAGQDVASGRFRLHRAVSEWLRGIAADRPLAVVLDDVHRADAETASLLTALAEALEGTRILLVVAYRPAEVTRVHEEALAALARCSPTRVTLRGLDEGEVATLVAAVCDRPVDAETVTALAERTGGNPFYVRESARLLAGEGALVATSEVPEGVRDVLRRRLARLPPAVVTVLRLAAVVGREADVDLLVQTADADEDGVLDALDAGVVSGLLTEPSPGRVRFVHALVRDTLYQDLSRIRLTRMHHRVAEALRERPATDPTTLAHHYARAGTAATAPLALHYSLRAAETATRRYAHDMAVELLRQALESFERITGEEGDHDARRVDILCALLRAQVSAGALGDARATRRRAIDVALAANREDLLITALSAWTQPTPWNVRPYAMVDRPLVDLLMRVLYGRRPADDEDPARSPGRTGEIAGRPGPAGRTHTVDTAKERTTDASGGGAEERTADAPGDRAEDEAAGDRAPDGGGYRLDPIVRCRLLDALCAELAYECDPRAARAVRELTELAARLGDPRVTASALMAQIKELDYEREAGEREALAAELADLADRHDLPAYRWYAEYVASTAAGARGDVAALRRHVRRCMEIADAYEMPEARGVGMCAEATLAHIAGRLDEAERIYLDAYAHMKRHGSLHADAFLVMAIGTMRVTQGRVGELVDPIQALRKTGGPVATDALALALAAEGRTEEARAARTPAHPLRRDYFFSTLATIRAMAIVALGERDKAEELIDALLPLRDHLPGAASTAVAMRPVAHTLGELSLLLGRRSEAAEHFTHAIELARRWQSPIWLAEAQDALTRCTTPPETT